MKAKLAVFNEKRAGNFSTNEIGRHVRKNIRRFNAVVIEGAYT